MAVSNYKAFRHWKNLSRDPQLGYGTSAEKLKHTLEVMLVESFLYAYSQGNSFEW